MKKVIIVLACLFKTAFVVAQNDSILVNISVKKRVIDHDSDYLVHIDFISRSKTPVWIDTLTRVFSYGDPLGNIHYELQRVMDSCFGTLTSSDMQPTMEALMRGKIHSRKVNYSDTVSYQKSIKDFHTRLRRGYYRLQMCHEYLDRVRNGYFEACSRWVYFM